MSSFAPALKICSDAQEFLTTELTSSAVLTKIEEFEEDLIHNEDGHYFELIAEIKSEIDDIQCICSKTYSHGLCICMVYFEGVFYSILQDAHDEQPLLDVEFPDVSKEGGGITLSIYDSYDNSNEVTWCKLSLWQCLSYRDAVIPRDLRPINATSAMYQQTYCILKPVSSSLGSEDKQAIREVLFRFGSWCYSGEVELVPTLSIDDIPHVIPALRLQQSNLIFLCDVSKMPCDNAFTKPLMHMFELNQIMERETVSTEEILHNLYKELERNAIPKKAKNWLDCNDADLFIEFTVLDNHVSVFSQNRIDLIASKCYHPNGIVIMCIYFRGVFYMCLSNGTGDQPLLDSTFPSLLQGRGCQLKSYPSGLPDWPDLRKISIWQNAKSFDANHKVENSKNGFDSELEVGVEGTHPEDVLDCSRHYATKIIMEKYLKCQTDVRVYDKEVEDIGFEFDGAARFKMSTKKNLGAFHHLAPLKQSSKLENCIENKSLLNNVENISVAPWGSDGRPL